MAVRPRTLVPAALGAVGLLGLAAGLAGLGRVEVAGNSMVPTLQPGDRLLFLRGARPVPGRLAVLRDPRRPDRLLVKRVVGRSGPGWEMVGDNPAASTDSRQFGAVPAALVVGRVVYRYHPPDRAGRR